MPPRGHFQCSRVTCGRRNKKNFGYFDPSWQRLTLQYYSDIVWHRAPMESLQVPPFLMPIWAHWQMKELNNNADDLLSLLRRGGEGDKFAYDEVLAKASERLLALTRKMLRNYPQLHRWEQTDDVFQQATLRLYGSLGDIKPESTRAFLRLAATQIRRTLIDLARHHFGPEGPHALHHSDVAGRAADDPGGVIDLTPGPSHEPDTLAAWAHFHESVEQLPNEVREVFELVWYDDMPQQEVANILSVSVPTVKRRWRAARLLLADAVVGDAAGL